MMSSYSTVEQLSPDGYSRFFILTGILKQLYGKTKRTLRILDVGGGSEYMEQQLQSTGIPYDLTILDIIDRPAKVKATYIQGDATNMRFKDDEFDVVISTDVLEHVPNKGKEAFLRESLRVAKEVCIIAAPFDTVGVNDAEIVVNEFNKRLFGVGQDWLEEHLALGKPTQDLFTRVLGQLKMPYAEFGTQNITTWLLNTHINLIDAKLGLSAKNHRAVNTFYNNHILEMNEFEGPTYRHFYVMFPDAAMYGKFDRDIYKTYKTNPATYSEYIDKLFILLADRIGEIKKYEKQTLKITEQHQKLIIEHKKLEKVAQEQARTLERVAPLLRVVRSKPVSALRSLSKNTKDKKA